MRFRPTRLVIIIAIFTCSAWLATEIAADEIVSDLNERLTSLNGVNAMAYFELAEEVAYEAEHPADTALAQHLFVLAFEIDRVSPAPRLGASVCLALADLSTTNDERRWLFALARNLSPSEEIVDLSGDTVGPTDAAALALSEALGLYRSGDYRRSKALLVRPEVAELLNRHESLLIEAAVNIEHELDTEPICHECNNRRIVRSNIDDDQQHRLCYTCGGNPGPDLSDRQLMAHLRLEAILLRGVHKSWAAQLSRDHGAPLRDAAADELAARFNIDASATLWRNSAWTQPPSEDEENDERNAAGT